jgi:hypothetical protein
MGEDGYTDCTFLFKFALRVIQGNERQCPQDVNSSVDQVYETKVVLRLIQDDASHIHPDRSHCGTEESALILVALGVGTCI